MKYCPSCGTASEEAAIACFACGSSIFEEAAPVSVEPLEPSSDSRKAGAVAYLAGLFTGVALLAIRRYRPDSFVRFHALQSIFLHVAWIALWLAGTTFMLSLGGVSRAALLLLRILIDLVLFAGGVSGWIYLMVSAYKGKAVQLPIVGAMAARYSHPARTPGR